MSHALTIAGKDLRLLFRDRRTAAMLLVLPLVFISIIGLTTGKFPGTQGSAPAFRVAVADGQDYDRIGAAGFLDEPPGPGEEEEFAPSDPLPPAEAARQRTLARNTVTDVIAQLNAFGGFRADPADRFAAGRPGGVPVRLPADPAAKARELVDDGTVDAAVVFGPNFYERALSLAGEDVLDREAGPLSERGPAALDVEVYAAKDAARTTTANAVLGVLRGRISLLLTCRDPRAAARLPRVCDRLRAEADAPPRDVPVYEPPPAGDATGVYDEIVPGYTVMFVFFLVNLMARSFLAERETGTLRRLRTTPVRPTSILIGKTLPFWVISVAQTATLFLAGRFLFGMDWGPRPWLILPVVVCCSAAATGLGLLIAAVVKSESQVSAYATSVVIVLAGVSGCFMPRDWLPDIMQTASLATPHAWALIAYDQILSVPVPAAGLVAECCGALLVFAAAFFAVGAWRFGGSGG